MLMHSMILSLTIKIRRKDTGPMFLLRSILAKIEDKITKEVEKARERFGEAFDEKKFRETNPACSGKPG